jgi:hypothetical protein
MSVTLATIPCLCNARAGNLVFMSNALNMHHPDDPDKQTVAA